MKSKKDFAKPADFLHYIYDHYKGTIDGSFHSMLWHLMIEPGVSKICALTPVMRLGCTMIGIAYANEPGGYQPTPCGFSQQMKHNEYVDICNEINLLLWGHSPETCSAIVCSSMAMDDPERAEFTTNLNHSS